MAAEEAVAVEEVAADPVKVESDLAATAGSVEPTLGATAGALEVEAAAVTADIVPSSPPGSPTKKKSDGKTLSLLGTNLAKKPSAGISPVSSTHRPVVERYAHEVREADRNRKIGYLPMQEQIQFKPAGPDVAREVRDELANITSSIGGAHNVSKGVGWDALLCNDQFQKRLQFLHEHSRTGHFVEQYGPDGHSYEGDFMHGMRHGKGKYMFRNETYDGEWKWDQRHGWGVLTCNDGNTIKGEFQNGKTHGFACVVDGNGTVIYEGEFKDGKRHGLGRQLFDSGDMYEGGWENGRLHGRGVYYFTNGDRLLGMWKEGVYHGIGVFQYADGTKSRREYNNGLLVSVQDFDPVQKWGKSLTRGGMQKHTRDAGFPKEVFLLYSA